MAVVALPVDVTLVEPDKMNLLGLILASIIRRRMAEPGAQHHARNLCGRLLIEAGGMTVGLSFHHRQVRIQRGAPALPVKAHIRGSLTALVDAALARRRIFHFAHGDLRVWGWPLTLWHFFHLVRASYPTERATTS